MRPGPVSLHISPAGLLVAAAAAVLHTLQCPLPSFVTAVWTVSCCHALQLLQAGNCSCLAVKHVAGPALAAASCRDLMQHQVEDWAGAAHCSLRRLCCQHRRPQLPALYLGLRWPPVLQGDKNGVMQWNARNIEVNSEVFLAPSGAQVVTIRSLLGLS